MGELPEIDAEDVEGDEGADDGEETVGEGEVEIALFGDDAAVEEVGDTDGVRDDGHAEREDEDGDEAFVTELEHSWDEGSFRARPGMEQG